MIKAVIFDFDGLIIDTESLWYEAFKEVMKDYNYDLPVHEFAICIGTKDDVLYSFLEDKLQRIINRDEVRNKTKNLVNEKVYSLLLREGVLEYLDEAKSLGLKVGLASSSSRKWVDAFLDQFNIRSYFQVIKTSNDVKKVKPDPELYIEALNALGVDSTEAIAFEDSKNGLEAAKGAGLRCVIVPNDVTSFLTFNGHSYRLQSMRELSLHELLHIIK